VPADDGGPDRRPRYADRFRSDAPGGEPGSGQLAGGQLGSGQLGGGSDVLGVGAAKPEPVRPRWPAWVPRVATTLALVAAAGIAIAREDGDGIPEADTTSPPVETAPPHEPPPVASIELVEARAEPWESRGFTYELVLGNPTRQAFELLDVGPGMSGTELAWTQDLEIGAGGEAGLRVDYLVVNCRAATTSAVPTELRLVLRHGGPQGRVELARLPIPEQAAAIEAQGARICPQGAGFDPSG
jgi:hypothetical protein